MKKVLSNKYYEVTEEDGYIRLKNRNNGIVIIPMTKDKKILMINIYRENIDKISMELPRGFLEKGESHIQGAIRELKEEINCKGEEIVELGYIYPDTGIMNSKINIVLIKECSIEKIILEEKEHIKNYELFTVNEVLEKIQLEEISDGFTISAMMRYILKAKGGKIK
ncbi:MAG: NUDIX hydrolase [Clostridium sp.]